MIFVSLVAAYALVILFGVADVLVSLYRQAVVAYNTVMPAPATTNQLAVCGGTVSNRARSQSPTRHLPPALDVGYGSSAGPQDVPHSNNVPATKPSTQGSAGSSGRNTRTSQAPAQQNNTYDTADTANRRQSVRKRKATAKWTARDMKKAR